METIREMDEDRGKIVHHLAYKFNLQRSDIQRINDAKCGGGQQHAAFLRLLTGPNSETTIDEVSSALGRLRMHRAKETWEKISRGKSDIWEVEEHEVLEMYPFLANDPTNEVQRSWIDLGQEIPSFSNEDVIRLEDAIQTAGKYSPAGELMKILHRRSITVRKFIDKLEEVNEDSQMPACQNVLERVENDIKKAMTENDRKGKN